MRINIKSIWLLLVVGLGFLFGLPVSAETVTTYEVSKLAASYPSTGARFGDAVTIEGDTALVGAWGSTSADIFARDGDGTWYPHQRLYPSDGGYGWTFGKSVALQGDTAIIGAYRARGLDNLPGRGAAYVFTRDETGNWTQQQKLVASDTNYSSPNDSGDYFGWAIALDGDTVIIGASEDNCTYPSSIARAGSAYVFTRDDLGVWTEQQKLVASDMLDGTGHEYFGGAVALEGDIAAIGARAHDGIGAVYMFTRDSAGVWGEQQILVASNLLYGAAFGDSVGIVGDTIIAGAAVGGPPYQKYGTAYVFTGDSSVGWTQQQELMPSDFGMGPLQFGASMDMEGQAVVIGAWASAPPFYGGAAYLFTATLGNWTEQVKFLASDANNYDYLGGYGPSAKGVAISGSTMMVGAPYGDTPGYTNTGAVYVFDFAVDDEGPITSNTLITPNPVATGVPFTILAIVDDSTTGGAAIESASYTLVSGGIAYPIPATDGSFDEVTEDVAETVSNGLPVGDYQVCLTGTDAVGNTGAETCTQLVVYIPDVEGPITSNTLVSPNPVPVDTEFTISALVDDTTTGGSTIASASYKLVSGGIAYPIPATDGSFDEVTEDVAETVSNGLPVGDYQVCLTGTDAVGNTGAETCTQLVVYIPDVEGPITSNTLVSPNPVATGIPFTISAIVDDSTTGGSAIDSAEYKLFSDVDQIVASGAMMAVDAAFDSITEEVTAMLPGLPVGVYDACVLGTDSAGNIGVEVCTLLAVYDPTAGFVTGAGFIDSPLGAYLDDPSLTGAANFSFVSRYKKGQIVPDGRTMFQFRAANLHFKSTAYDWLVVAGSKGMFKGSGTINGIGNYGFLLSALDADLTPSAAIDRFRIQIWDKDNADAVIYDNEVGEDDSEVPTTEITKGSIKIHTTK